MPTTNDTSQRSNQRFTSRAEQEEPGYLARGACQIRHMVEDHAGRSVLTALAVGFGVGLAIGKALGHSSSHKHWTDRVAAEGIGRRFLERLDQFLPEAISSRLDK
jgi:hypothetical protein